MEKANYPAQLLRWILLICAITVFASSKFSWKHLLGNELSDISYGDITDQAAMSLVHTKIPLLPKYQYQTWLQTSDIIFFWDSFFESTLDSFQFADEVALNSDITTHHIPVDNLMREVNFNPILYLQAINYTGSDQKIMVLESVERYALDIATHYDKLIYEKKSVSSFDKLHERSNKPLLNTSRIRYFFTKNKILWPFIQWKTNYLYEFLWEIPSSIWVIDETSWMMFHHEQFSFLQREKNDAYLDEIAKKIAWIQEQLVQQFNITLQYMIIPNKISIYPELAWVDYDNFIPRFENILRKNGVNYISAYNKLQKSKLNERKAWLYFKNDTHFTRIGKEIIVREVIDQIKSSE